MAQALTTVLSKERARLAKARTGILAQQKKLARELAALDREIAAIAAYERVKSGKVPIAARAPTTKGPRPGSKRAPRGSRQQAVIDAIGKSSAGMSRGEILKAMGLKGNKSGEQSVSNALNALKKAKKLNSKDGKYTVA